MLFFFCGSQRIKVTTARKLNRGRNRKRDSTFARLNLSLFVFFRTAESLILYEPQKKKHRTKNLPTATQAKLTGKQMNLPIKFSYVRKSTLYDMKTASRLIDPEP